MTDHVERLRKAGEAYQQARAEAERIIAGPRQELAEAAKTAYSAKMRKADILRAMGHVWSTTWLDKILRGGETPKTDKPN